MNNDEDISVARFLSIMGVLFLAMAVVVIIGVMI